MLPMWSPSSWDRNTQRTSAGSTTEATRVEPAFPEQGGAGVDDDGLLGEDHHRVHEHVRAGLGRDEVGDQVRVAGDALRLGDGGRGVHDRSFAVDWSLPCAPRGLDGRLQP